MNLRSKSLPRDSFKLLNYLFIFNATAGSYSETETQEIKALLGRNPFLQGKIISTRSSEELEGILEDYRDLHPHILGIGGGDGTVHHTLTAVRDAWGYVPEYVVRFALGTVNQDATNFDLSDGIIDKLRKVLPAAWHQLVPVNYLKSKPLQLAEFLSTLFDLKELPTEEVPLFSINDFLGLNIGFQNVPKLLWTYYGKTIEQYRRLEEDLKFYGNGRYGQELHRIWDETTLVDLLNGQAELIKRSGVVQGISTFLTSILGTFDAERIKFFEEPFEGEIYLNGKKLELPQPANAVYISAYESMNLGIKELKFCPSPEARVVLGKMQVILGCSSLLGTILQIPSIAAGRHLQDYHYYHASEVVLKSPKPIIAQVDADFQVADEFVIKYYQTLKYISPFKK